jgi:carboxyl-terminal processing protease
MLGIFIDIGPLGVTKIYDGRRETIKDLNRGTIYDGPLVVMVNGASASASEILAATLQDYRKAIIAGSTTFGKATMQIVVPLKNNFDLDQYDPSKEKEDESTEYLKLTIGKLYRVSGKTAQNTGVVPDVYLPDYFEAGQFTERSYPTALPADTVVVGFTPRIMPEKYHAASLQQFVQTSVLTDPQFVQLQQEVEKIKHNGTDRVPLLLEEFDAWNKTLEEEPTAMADTIATNLAFKVANTRLDADYNTMDAYQKENDEAIMEDLHADQWLRQVYLLFKKILIK